MTHLAHKKWTVIRIGFARVIMTPAEDLDKTAASRQVVLTSQEEVTNHMTEAGMNIQS